MSHFSTDDLDRLAALAQLRLTDADRSRLATDLAQILEYVDRLRAVPTDGVPGTAHIVEGAGDLRPDVPVASLPASEALRNAPEAQKTAGLFRVPRVIGA